MLAVTLMRSECVALLLEKGANVEVENAGGWTGDAKSSSDKVIFLFKPFSHFAVVQEAVATGVRQLLHQVLTKRDLQRHTTRMVGVPALLHRLKEVFIHFYCIMSTVQFILFQAPDFYMEMKWEFTSWGIMSF